MPESPKNDHPFCKSTGHGCCYSKIDSNGVGVFNAVVSPVAEGGIRKQLESAIARLDAVLKRERLEGCVIAHNVFLRDIADAVPAREILMEYYGNNLPVINYIPQKPCNDKLPFYFEILAERGNTRKVRIIRRNEHAVTVDIEGVTFGYFGNFAASSEASGAYDQSMDAFNQMCLGMAAEGFEIADLVRTWLYQGGIVRSEGNTQRYKELNRARTDFFEGIRFLENFIPEGKKGAIYPASTGIGTDGLGIRMAGLAILRNEYAEQPNGGKQALVSIPLENPGQTPAFDYAESYSPQSPKFSRAVALEFASERCGILISGTASIVDSETVHIGDPAAQARQTLENIRLLISGDNLDRHGIKGFDATLANMAIARVYVKRKEDYPAIRAVCDEILGNTPLLFVIADVCRDDLLVEIEGVAFCGKQ